MKPSPNDKLDHLLREYPFLVDFLARLAPKFGKLRNPLLRKTLGKVATLDQVAREGGLPVEGLLEAIEGEIRRVTGSGAVGASSPGVASVPADRSARKDVLKGIIRDLHHGEDVEVLRKRFADLASGVSGSEIGAMEQELIAEGLPEDEVKKLCDIHVRVFEEALEENPEPTAVPGHPVHTLMEENRALEKLVVEIRAALAGPPPATAAADGAAWRPEVGRLLDSLAQVEKHYLKKENQLFPLLEAKGVSGPSKVMWAVHDDIREHLKDLRRAVEANDRDLAGKAGVLVLKEISDMIYKEEKILFPMSLETLDERDWARVKRGEEEIGYAWITPGRQWVPVPMGGDEAAPARAYGAAGLDLDTGTLTPEQVNLILTHLPVDLSFVDEDDTVRYYSATRDRIFTRTPAVIGRTVQNCHPPTSVHVVNGILQAFREGRRDAAEFWIDNGGRFVHIRYFAVRDSRGRYRGCLEVSQDVTAIRALRGEKRLLDWE